MHTSAKTRPHSPLRLVAMAFVVCALLVAASAQAQEPIQAPLQEAPPDAVTNPPKEASATATQSQNSLPDAQAARSNGNYARPGDLPEAEARKKHLYRTLREELLSFVILVFGLVVLGVQYLLLRGNPNRPAQEILQLLSINLIITGTLFLISAGLSAQDIAPALGLFGTVAGYVLGRRVSERATANASHTGNPP